MLDQYSRAIIERLRKRRMARTYYDKYCLICKSHLARMANKTEYICFNCYDKRRVKKVTLDDIIEEVIKSPVEPDLDDELGIIFVPDFELDPDEKLNYEDENWLDDDTPEEDL